MWGELHLTYLDGPLALSELERGHLLAEVLGAALASAGADAAGARRPAGTLRRSRWGPRTRIPTR